MTKQKVKEPKRIYIEYHENETGGEAEDPNDRWSDYADTVKEVEFIKLYREVPKDRFFYHSVEVSNEDLLKLDKLYLAVVRYTDGGTFGKTIGYWEVIGVAPTYKIAELMLEEAIKSTKKGDYKNYKPWEGYFASLNDTEIHKLDVV